MRIFCAVRHANDPKHSYSGLWSGNFYPALRELGHEIVESQVDLLLTSRFMDIAGGFTPQELEARARTTEQIVAEVRAAHRASRVGLFLSYFYNSHFEPAAFDELRRLGIPSVNFYCNSIYQFKLVSAIAAKVDFAWHVERDARALYLAVGANPVWVQMGADPQVYFPVPDRMRESRSVFVGQRYADRDRWLAALVRAQVPVDIYGSGWLSEQSSSETGNGKGPEDLGRYSPEPGSLASYVRLVREELLCEGLFRGAQRVTRQAMYRHRTRAIAEMLRPYAKGRAADVPSVFANYEVCLNFSNVWEDGRSGSRLISHLRLRDFEAPMCRTCYLTGYTEEITEFYEVGREIDTYRTEEEFVEKTQFYLTHPDAAETLREAGYRRALRDHTWKCRFEELFRKLNLAA